MKRLVLAAALSITASGAVSAADLYAKAPAPLGYDWSGFYIGGHVGGAQQWTAFNDPTAPLTASAGIPYYIGGYGDFFNAAPSQSLQSTSILGGFQAGANYQIGHLVLGGEFDVSWTSLKKSTTVTLPTNAYYYVTGASFSDTESFQERTDWITTATTRLGFAWNTLLIYGKVGAAWESDKYALSNNMAINAIGYPPPYLSSAFSANASETRIGWTVGGGLEWAFANNWTAKLEYDFMDFGSVQEGFTGTTTVGGSVLTLTPYLFNNTAAVTANPSVSQSVSEVKFGINYKFGPGFVFW